MRMVGSIVGMLGEFLLMVLFRSLVAKRKYLNYHKVNTLHQKKLRIFMLKSKVF